jgi:MarR family transcriptional regulator, organic hydroperoxide resistance regulator
MKAPLEAPPEVPPLGEGLEFLRLIWAVHHGLEKTSKQMDVHLGVTGPQRLVVRIVGRFPGIPAGRLAQILHVHPSTLTGVLKRLERRGFIERRPDPRDGRRVSLGLTARGRRLDVAAGTVEGAVNRALHVAGSNQVRAAGRVLKILAETLERTQPL